MSCLLNPAAISSTTRSSSLRYSSADVATVTRSKRTPYRWPPTFTGANGAVWIWPDDAIEQHH